MSFDLVLGRVEDRVLPDRDVEQGLVEQGLVERGLVEPGLVELTLVELRRLGAEDAWARTRTGRDGPVLQMSIAMMAGDQHQAVTGAARILRTSLARCGLATTGWERLTTPSARPTRRRGPTGVEASRSRRQRSAPSPAIDDQPRPSLWDAHTAVARSWLDGAPPLPPFVVRLGPDPVIDLR